MQSQALGSGQHVKELNELGIVEVEARLVLGADSDIVASSGRSDSGDSDSKLALHFLTWSFHLISLALLLIAWMSLVRDLALWKASAAASSGLQ